MSPPMSREPSCRTGGVAGRFETIIAGRTTRRVMTKIPDRQQHLIIYLAERYCIVILENFVIFPYIVIFFWPKNLQYNFFLINFARIIINQIIYRDYERA